MLQKIKTWLPWVLIVGLVTYIIILEKKIHDLKTKNESTIETQIKTEESVIDSLFILRHDVENSKDSAINAVDSLSIFAMSETLKKNLEWWNENYNR